MTGEKIWRALGRGHRDRIKGKLQTIMDGIDRPACVSRLLETCLGEAVREVPHLPAHGSHLERPARLQNPQGTGLLEDVRQRLYQVVDRFAGQQAVNLNVHDDFTLLRRIALPVEAGGRKTPGIRVRDARMIRLLEVLLHAGSWIGGWSARQIHASVSTTFNCRHPGTTSTACATTCGS